MRQSLMLSTAILSALSGCENPFTHKPVLDFHNSTNQSHDPASPVITLVPTEATYTLVSLDNQESTPLLSVRLSRGDRVGFRRENEHMVAVAGKQTFPIPDGIFGWAITDQKPDQWEQGMEKTKETVNTVKQFLAPVAAMVVVVCVAAGVIVGGVKGGAPLQGFDLSGLGLDQVTSQVQ